MSDVAGLGASRRVRRSLVPVLAGVLTLAVATPAWAEPGLTSVATMPLTSSDVGLPISNTDLSCPTSTWCASVLPAYGTAGVVTESGGVWSTPLPLTPPPDSTSVNLSSISCSSPMNCTAVGLNGTAGAAAIAATDAGGTWSGLVTIPVPASWNAGFANLDSVSCSAPGQCVAVGTYGSIGQASYVFAVTQSAGTWGTPVQLADTPITYGTGAVSLGCADAQHCTAIGWDFTTNGDAPDATFAWTFTNGSWSGPALVDESGTFSSTSVACPTTSTCLAVGSINTWSTGASKPAYDVETDGQWGTPTALPLPRLGLPLNRGELVAIACLSATTCIALAQLEDFPYADLTGMATWADGEWSSFGLVQGTQPLGVATGDGDVPGSISCVATACTLDGFASLLHDGTDVAREDFSAVVVPRRPMVQPQPPRDVTASGLVHGVAVTWLPPFDDGGAAITGFSASVLGTVRRCTATGWTCSIGGLVDGASYRVGLTDETAWGDSREVVVAVVAGVVPSAPTHLRLALRRGRLVVTWMPSTAPADEPVRRYEASVTWLGRQVAACSSSTTTCSVPVHALAGTGTVAVTVRAENASGWSAPLTGAILS